MLYPLDMQQTERQPGKSIMDDPVPCFVGSPLTYLARVEALTPMIAAAQAQREAAFKQSSRRKLADFKIIAMFEGWPSDINPLMPRR